METEQCVPSDSESKRLEPIARHIAMLNGLLFLEKDGGINHIPLTLLPSPFPKKAYQCMSSLQISVNAIYHKAACDHQFLMEAFQDLVQQDHYMKKLWEIYMTVREEMTQRNFLGLIRSDYMLQCDDSNVSLSHPKQIEVNLLAAGLGSLSEKLVDTHRLLLKMSELKTSKEAEEMVPPNNAARCVAGGILSAHKLYDSPKASILFIVGDQERNVFDQRALEEAIYKQEPTIRVLRRTFGQLHAKGVMELRGPKRRLFVDDSEIAVVYFRHGYSPVHFQESWTWDVKLTLERSYAIKSPSIQHILVNTKKVQQMLSLRHFVERFVKNKDEVEKLMSVTLGQFDPREKKNFDEAIACPERFVLKPQREGGGNNYFGPGLKERMKELHGDPALGAYVLMERVHPPEFVNYALLARQPIEKRTMVSELGVFGVVLGNDNEIYENFGCGHLMRSKSAHTNEGGVYSGYSCLDSPLLF